MVGCGRTAPAIGSMGERDGGSRGATVEAQCGEAVSYTAPGRAVDLRARLPEGALTKGVWSLIEQPNASKGSVLFQDAIRATITPDVTGHYELQFRGRSEGGALVTCSVEVIAIAGAPAAICPRHTFSIPANTTIMLEGASFDAEGGVRTYRWEIEQKPAGASVALKVIETGRARLEADTRGTYRIALIVTDEGGNSDRCTFEVRVLGAPRLECTARSVTGRTREPTELHVTHIGGAPVEDSQWKIAGAPPDADAHLKPTGDLTATLMADRPGIYRIDLRARDRGGHTARCRFRVLVKPTPPDAVCPDVVRTEPRTETQVGGRVVDDGRIVSHEWRIEATPPGSAAPPVSPRDALETSLRPDIAGNYRLRLAVTDDDGNTDACTTIVRAVAREGLRVEMFWNTEGTDMDLHLLHPEAEAWFGGLDCYFDNCTTVTREWFAQGPADNPSLDIDDQDGFGPENINIQKPVPGTYRIGVDQFSGSASAVVVRVFCPSGSHEPKATFGPVALQEGREECHVSPFDDDGDECFWRVADVTITEQGTCEIEDLARGNGEPNIQWGGYAHQER